MASSALQSPLGTITITEEAGVITRLDWRALPGDPSDLTVEAAHQLRAYFAGKLSQFDLPLHWGTGINEQVRRAMAAIPLGETRTYGDLARALHAPPKPSARPAASIRSRSSFPAIASLAPTAWAGFRPMAALKPRSGS